MSNRELILDVVSKLPENASMADIVEQIRFVAGVREALEESERGEGVPIEEARKLIRIWASKSS